MTRHGIRRHGQSVYVERPALGRYVFVRMLALEVLTWPDQYYRIVSIRGVYGVLLNEERPCVVRHAEVMQLKDKEVRGFLPNVYKQRFRPFQKVIVSRGPFVNLAGTLKREKGVLDVVEISLFGSSRELVLPMASIVAA
jgi:transcription antitermination factor NusG